MGQAHQIHLPDVTLLAATAVGIEDTVEALQASMRHIRFAAVKLLAPVAPHTLPAGIELARIPPMDFLGYSRFILAELHRHFVTSHCLVVQADGFVVDAGKWRKEFLDFDYIGAPWADHVLVQPGNWKLHLDRNRVGNGGFSLRSRKLMQVAAGIDFNRLDFPLRSEDLVLCHFLHGQMCAQGISFAPAELAAQFSMESTEHLYGQTLDTVFGFHGKALLPEVLQRQPAETFAGLRKQYPPEARRARLPPGRNAPCPCGSTKRFKDCHGRLV